jgi:hypothetical protein
MINFRLGRSFIVAMLIFAVGSGSGVSIYDGISHMIHLAVI